MPTHRETPTFLGDYGRLGNTQEKLLGVVHSQFIADLRVINAGEPAWFRPECFVGPLTGAPDLRGWSG